MEEYRRKNSIRRPGWNYQCSAYYFITICCWNRASLFASYDKDELTLLPAGQICYGLWNSLPERTKDIELGAFVVMPDHFHAILGLFPESATNVGSEVRLFKSAVTREIRLQLNKPELKVWQRGYHDRILRNQTEYMQASEYIIKNPERGNDSLEWS